MIVSSAAEDLAADIPGIWGAEERQPLETAGSWRDPVWWGESWGWRGWPRTGWPGAAETAAVVWTHSNQQRKLFIYQLKCATLDESTVPWRDSAMYSKTEILTILQSPTWSFSFFAVTLVSSHLPTNWPLWQTGHPVWNHYMPDNCTARTEPSSAP